MEYMDSQMQDLMEGSEALEKEIASWPSVTVCDNCLMACCWQGIFMCDEARYAGTIEKTTIELMALRFEHYQYWKPEEPADD